MLEDSHLCWSALKHAAAAHPDTDCRFRSDLSLISGISLEKITLQGEYSPAGL